MIFKKFGRSQNSKINFHGFPMIFKFKVSTLSVFTFILFFCMSCYYLRDSFFT
eukprot:UN01618